MKKPIQQPRQTILVFKTNIQYKREVKQLAPLFNTPEIIKWNIDLDDCDKVLRVITHKLTSIEIALAAKEKGFECKELE